MIGSPLSWTTSVVGLFESPIGVSTGVNFWPAFGATVGLFDAPAAETTLSATKAATDRAIQIAFLDA